VEKRYCTWLIDSDRWRAFRPRANDVVVATYPKSGTTWMQRIVGLLVFQDPAPLPVMEISVWIDRRFLDPIETAMATIAAQTHRRFLKAHLPADGLPLCDEVSYIHVARDGRDACLSFHNHAVNFSEAARERLDRAGLGDPEVARPYPETPADPADFFHRWLAEGVAPGEADGLPVMSWFSFERSWWYERPRPNVLLVHYADLKADLAGEMRRIAGFLGIVVPDALWPELVEAAGFESMRRAGDTLMGRGRAIFREGSASFFHRGTNGRWQGVFRADDLARYDAKCADLPHACAHWLGAGRAGGEP